MGNFACIKIRIFSTNDSLGYNDSNFHNVYFLADIQETRIKRKNIYNAKISTFTVVKYES